MKLNYKQTEIGLIPEDWTARKIGELAKIRMCKRIFAEQTTETGDIPFFKIGTFGGTPDAYISRSIYDEYKSKYSYPSKGDILISAAGTLGRTVVFDGNDAYFQDSNIVWLDIDKSQVCNEYLNHYYKVIVWNSSEGSTIARLYNGIIESTYIAYPPLPEQERIAEALSDVDALIASLEKLIAKKKAIKQGAMQRLLTGKTRLPGFAREWVEGIFGELFEILPNNTYSRDQLSTGGKIKNIHYGDILVIYNIILNGESNLIPTINTDLETKKRRDYCYIKNGDIIIADTAEDNTVGKAVEMVNVNGKILSGLHTFLCRPRIEFAPMFLGYYINSTEFHDQMLPFITGTKVSSINKASLNMLKIRYPSKKEQYSIANVLFSMDNEIESLSQKLAKTRQLKQGMMQQLLTGKIRLV